MPIPSMFLRIFAAIDTAAFKHNYLLLTKAIPNGTNTIAVIKANGYGHGALKLAEILENDNELSQCKPEFFAVAEIEEARKHMSDRYAPVSVSEF